MDNKEALLEFVKEHRGSEANYEKIKEKVSAAQGIEGLADAVHTEGTVYEKARTHGTAWPEFEKFVTAVERVLIG